MLIIFTGNGKGKTTAALGQALRAVGDGKKVLMIQFIKGPWKSGEDFSSKKLSSNFKIVKTGKGFVGILGDTLPFAKHKEAATKGLALARKEIKKKKWNILILDEIWNALHLGLLNKKEIKEFIKYSIPKLDHLIMTGRDCPKEFIEMADLVTEMKEIKHPFSRNIKGAKGLEF
jgi:cob(I)alamin adenosyltransferase